MGQAELCEGGAQGLDPGAVFVQDGDPVHLITP
jgi:hypothetical protein